MLFSTLKLNDILQLILRGRQAPDIQKTDLNKTQLQIYLDNSRQA